MDACLVIGAEETNWILADALWHLDRSAVIAGGAGALCLCRDPEMSVGVELAAITDAHTYSARNSRMQAARAMRGNWAKVPPAELLCDGPATARARTLRNARRGAIGPGRVSAPSEFWVKA